MKVKYALLSVCSIMLSVSGFAAVQGSQGVFIEIDSSKTSAMAISSTDKGRGIVSKNKVNVNVEALLNGSSVRGVADSRELVADPDAGKGFDMQLPDGTLITLVTHRVHSYVQGVETYSGRLKDIDTGHFTLSIENGKVFGQVNIEYMAYDIKYDKENNSQILTEIDLARMPHDTPEPPNMGSAYKESVQGVSGPTQFLSGSAIGTVRVLILHGSDVSNPSTLASNIISKMNDAFFDDNMDPDLHVTLADLRNVNDDFDGLCKLEILDDMRTATAPFTNIATWIDDEYADVVLTIATTQDNVSGCPTHGRYGGIAYQYDAAPANPDDPLAVTMDTYAIGDYTALHEIGHVFGGFHSDWAATNTNNWYPNTEPDSRGFISSTGDWQTIMGSFFVGGCVFSSDPPNGDCVRLPLWSNPSKSYSGETRGQTHVDATTTPFSANMASALEVQMPIVAVNQSYPDSAPSVPGNFRVISENCHGQSIAYWNSTSTAENYQLLRSYSSAFTNPEVIYFGSNTSFYVNVSQGQPWYLKVRACNGSGCGNLSAQKLALYKLTCN